ncbi:isopeptide-forming domain-containing fimbrial protein [Bifidobacterium sp. ESL0690]|uniref:isopeptide-forming domain-containing fimbrial protein n=1 Tax=Bifidobacterium sp. ESL0690 TaxID=2983214 RepID=UPI0023F64DE4|nr:isopeptide-forming domain-containing fimbrial protein [Bifidobacterium sp. ESL0690]WEV46898.1 isopeptide-forming domain-containing fimbrial protein [Bifidobacterium sp. ESL0690]
MSSKKLRALAAGAIAAATLLAFSPLSGVANAATQTMNMSGVTAPNIVINGTDATMKDHTFVAVKIGDYLTAQYDDTTPSGSTPGTLTSVSVGTTADAKAAATDALTTAKGSSAADTGYDGNPVGEVASKWLGYAATGSSDTTSNSANSAWSGKLRDFVTALMKSTVENGSHQTFSQMVGAGTPTTASLVSGTTYQASIPVSSPGIYVVVDTTTQPLHTGSTAFKDAIPMLVSTGITSGSTSYTQLGAIALGTVNMKGDAPSVRKALDTSQDNSDTSVGGKLHYVLTSAVPLTTGYDHYIFTMSDHPGTGLTFDDTVTPVVKVDTTTLTATTPHASGDYTFTHNEDANGNTTYMVFDLSPSIRSQTYGKPITITYAMKINDNAVSGQPLKNGVTVSYSNDTTKQPSADAAQTDSNGNVVNCVPAPSSPNPCTNGDVTKDDSQDGSNSPTALETYFHHFDVMKVKKSDGTGLKGATFQLTKKGETTPITFLKQSNGVYKKAANQSENGATANLAVFDGTPSTSTADTPHDLGQLQIDGLADGVYTLKETVAPSGYSSTFMPSTDVQVGGGSGTNAADSKFANTKDAVFGLIDANGTVASGSTPAALGAVSMASGGAVLVNNVNSISQLPLTGGVGILMMLLLIVVLAMIVAALVIARRKLNKSSE